MRLRSIGLIAAATMLTVDATASAAATGNNDSGSVKPSLLDGVKIGMTPAEARAAIKKSDPKIGVFDAYATHGPGKLALLLKSQIKPSEPAFFSSLIATRALSEQDLTTTLGSTCARTPSTATIIKVLFTTDLRDPRVALIDEYSYYCDGRTTTESVISRQLARFGDTPSRVSGVRTESGRWLIDVATQSNGYSVLQWRDRGDVVKAGVDFDVEAPVYEEGVYENRQGFGHAGGGIVAASVIKPK